MDATTLPTLLLGGDPQGDPRRHLRRRGARPSSCPPCAGWSSGARCCSRRTATSPRRSTSPPGWCTGTAADERRDNARWVRPLGTAGRGRVGRRRSTTPSPGWQHTGLYAWSRSPPVRAAPSTTGERRARRRPAARGPGRVAVDPAGERHEAAARPGGSRSSPARPTSPTCRAGLAADGAPPRAARRGSRSARARATRAAGAAAVPARGRRRGPRRAARRGHVLARGPQLRRPRGARRRLDHRLRGRSRRRATGAPTRRTSTTRSATGVETELEEIYYFEVTGRADGGCADGCAIPVGYQRVYGTDDAARSTCSPRSAPATSSSCRTAGTARRWRAPGYDLYYLNVMAGPGRRAGLADLRRPRATAGCARRGPARTSTPDFRSEDCDDRDDAADGAPDRGARPWSGSSPTSGPSATASGRSSSPAASASSATATSPGSARRCCRTSSPTATERLPYVLARNEQAMVHTVGRPTPGRRTGCRRGRAPRRSAPARPTCSPAPRSRRSTGSRCCCCPRARSRPGCPAPVLQELEAPYAARRHRQRRLPPAVAVLRPGQPARAAARRRCSARCGCSPTRSRPAR